MNVCYLVITGLILSTDKGEVKLATFLDDRAMHSLYEKFILEYYRYHHPEYKANPDTIPWDIDDGMIEFLPAMVTDIALKYGGWTLIIDAKYYDPVLEEGKIPSNQPGIESVTKQYLYQLAYTDFINKYGFSKDIILNCFIFPSEKEYVEKKGKVVMRMFNVLNVEPKLNGIHILFVPASKFYQLYLESKKISINDIFNICCTQF